MRNPLCLALPALFSVLAASACSTPTVSSAGDDATVESELNDSLSGYRLHVKLGHGEWTSGIHGDEADPTPLSRTGQTRIITKTASDLFLVADMVSWSILPTGGYDLGIFKVERDVRVSIGDVSLGQLMRVNDSGYLSCGGRSGKSRLFSDEVVIDVCDHSWGEACVTSITDVGNNGRATRLTDCGGPDVSFHTVFSVSQQPVPTWDAVSIDDVYHWRLTYQAQ